MEDNNKKFKREWWENEATINGILASPLGFVAGGPVGFLATIGCGVLLDALDKRDKEKLLNQPLSHPVPHQPETKEELEAWCARMEIQMKKEYIRKKIEDAKALKQLEEYIKTAPNITIKRDAMYNGRDFSSRKTYSEIPFIIYSKPDKEIERGTIGFTHVPYGFSAERTDVAYLYRRTSLFLKRLMEEADEGKKIMFYIPKMIRGGSVRYLYNIGRGTAWRVCEYQILENVTIDGDRSFDF